MRWNFGVVIILSLFLSACLTRPSADPTPSQQIEERVQVLELKMAEEMGRLEQRLLRLEEMVQAKESESSFTNSTVAVENSPPLKPIPENRLDEMAEFPAPSVDPEALYNRALESYQNREFNQGLSLFSEFIGVFPGHKLIPNAYYWAAETYYDQKNFKEALENFKKVTDLFPSSPKAPDALLKMGFTYKRMGQLDQAQACFRQIEAQYPFSQAFQKAKELLANP